jgi:hypothetical protein
LTKKKEDCWCRVKLKIEILALLFHNSLKTGISVVSHCVLCMDKVSCNCECVLRKLLLYILTTAEGCLDKIRTKLAGWVVESSPKIHSHLNYVIDMFTLLTCYHLLTIFFRFNATSSSYYLVIAFYLKHDV